MYLPSSGLPSAYHARRPLFVLIPSALACACAAGRWSAGQDTLFRLDLSADVWHPSG
jgi:hypothetical protein